MSGIRNWFNAVILIKCIGVIHGRICDGGSVIPFIPVSETNYEWTYANIQDDGRRPLGFMKGTWYYDNPYDGQLCVLVNNTKNRRIEVMVQTSPQSRICVRNKIDSRCNQEIVSCLQAPDNTPSTIYEFYCDAECSQTDVNFWYRFTVSDPAANDPNDWCLDRNSDEFPESLFVLPYVPSPKPTHRSNFNSSPKIHSSNCVVSSSSALLIVLNFLDIKRYVYR
ncbi:uncharacterized protein LOC141900121 [Tubulanus polymorphus]|uniref:uncharacterized protein LOC141900121 n=1 Tax=Tubulanus polymorphus TaxID=672921 RepID=UPI003DA1E026